MNYYLLAIPAIVFLFAFAVFRDVEQSDPTLEQYISLEHRPNYDLKNIEKLLVEYTNEKRIKHGVQPLEIDNQLYLLAKERSHDMVTGNYFDHVNLDGLTVQDIAINTGYKCEKEYEGISYDGVSENIALRPLSKSYIIENEIKLYDWHTNEKLFAELSINSVMDSTEHKENMLHPVNTKIGIGIAINSENKLYQTQLFC